jgi:hypothetical protein
MEDDCEWLVLVLVEDFQLSEDILDGGKGHVLRHPLPARIALMIDVTVAAIDVTPRCHLHQDGFQLHAGIPERWILRSVMAIVSSVVGNCSRRTIHLFGAHLIHEAFDCGTVA